MKKGTLILTAVIAMAVIFSSCKEKEKTKTELLTIKKGWVLSAATSSPAYALSDGSFATDLMKDGYLYECELDEVIKFTDNGAQTIVPNTLCEEFGYQTETAALWTFEDDETILKMQLPMFYNAAGTSFDEEFEKCQILALTEKELRLKYTFTDTENPTKGEYSFTLTYVPAK